MPQSHLIPRTTSASPFEDRNKKTSAASASPFVQMLFIGPAIMAILIIPGAALTVLAAAFVAQATIFVLQLWAGRDFPQPRPTGCGSAAMEPFFSVHVPTHNEPPHVVLGTLACLAAQETTAQFEVIVVDNNTDDPLLWHPVAEFCHKHRDRFQFTHVDQLTGAKAGALRIAQDMMASEATHIVTVDADYHATPGFLETARRRLEESGADYLQFPQAYRSESSAAAEAAELGDYFVRLRKLANVTQTVLLTGTLSVVSVDALERAGGWRSDTLTEDADLGVRLVQIGARGLLCRDVVGRGLLPLTARGFEMQRWRWAAGNLEVLLRAGALTDLSLRKRLGIWSQLTFWLNTSVVATLMLGLGTAAGLLGQAHASTIVLASSALLVFAFASNILPFALSERRAGTGWRALGQAVTVRIGLMPVSSIAAASICLGHRSTFRVTPKSRGGYSGFEPGYTLLFALVGIIVATLIGQWPFGYIAALTALLFLPMSALVFTDLHLKSYAVHTEESAR